MQKVILITGTSSGIGFETANYLTKKGHIVYGFSRSYPQDEALFETIIGDVTNEDSIKAALQKIMQNESRLDVVVNNAGMGISGSCEHTELEQIQKIFNINAIGVFLVCKLSIPYLRASMGKIINIGSVAGELPIPFQSFYSATKASVEAYSLALSSELKPFNIKVSIVLPGDTKTSFTKNRQKNETETNELYGERIIKSLQKMEKDEESGMSPLSVSRVIEKLIKQKNPSAIKTVGLKYKTIIFLKRFLPVRFVNYLIYKMYG